MATKLELPPPLPPTNHPWYRDDRHPLKNVFQLMPVRVPNLRNLEGAVRSVNIATYIDPCLEMDVIRALSRIQPWLLNLDVQFDQVRPIEHNGPTLAGSQQFPADHRFTGQVVSHDAGLGVVGVMHPEIPGGWMAFVDEIPGIPNPETSTVADLRASMGKISMEAAAELNHQAQIDGTFIIGGVEFR